MPDRPVTFEDLVGDVAAPAADTPATDKPRGKAGRPRFKQPETFLEALAALSPNHAEFARGIVAGLTQADAYRSAFPTANLTTARSNGKSLTQNKGISAAIRLGKVEMATELRTVTRYDIIQAHAEIDRHIAEAVRLQQMNAVASLVREKLKMFKLTDTHDAVSANAGFIFKVEGVGEAHVIEAKPKGVSDEKTPD